MQPIQLDLFEEYDELTLLRKELAQVRESGEKVRKGLFARHNELSKMYLDLKQDQENIRRLLIERKK